MVWKWQQYPSFCPCYTKFPEHKVNTYRLNYQLDLKALQIAAYDYLNYRFESNYYLNGQGFQIKYDASSEDPETNYMFGACNGYFTTSNGTISSPSYPGLYPNRADCTWTISQPIGTYILLTFQSMNVEYHGTCVYDYLYITDGYLNDSPALSTLCGTVVPSPVQSTQNSMRLR